MTTTLPLAPKEYATDQEVRWCPGCGDYAILKAVQKALSDLGARRENTLFVSGIGCSSRFPYYMSTYGFHTIHGRAPAVATGVKLANPDLDVWVVTGDGDGLSIGGNHLVHLLRRNLDVQLLLFNNEIYGLTKGQASPTSRLGTRSPSTPRGSIDPALVPATFALGAGARFVARAIDTQQAGLVEVLKRAHAHRGTSFVEIYQNCVVFNDGVFDEFTAKDVAPERQLHVEHGKPMLFGKDRNHGIRMKPGTLALEVVTLGENGVGVSDVLVHDQANRLMAQMLAALRPPEFPVALGVLYDDPAPSYEVQLGALLARDQVAGSLESVLRGSQTWSVEE
jgi:2-oxoglutarate ferredoxin oxidoreductase subunit beta